MGGTTKLALALMLALVVITVAEGVEYKEIVNASQILTNISQGGPVEYNHVIVKGNLSLSNLQGLPTKHIVRSNFESMFLGASEYIRIITFPIRITDSIIDGPVNFNNTLLENITDFTGSTFNSSADFSASTFNSSADFSHSTFNHYVDFSYSKLNSYADFSASTFNSSADFRYSTVNSYADFGASTFNSIARFSDSAFNSITKFSASTFNSSADFRYSTFNNSTNFEDVVFQKEIIFSDSEFRGDTSFKRSKFKEDAFFEDAHFNCTLYLMRTKYGNLYIRWRDIKNLDYDDVVYLSLMENFKRLGYLEDYDNCYVEYRKGHRGQSWSGGYHGMWPIGELIMKNFDVVSEWSYGYGKKPLNPIVGSLIVIILFGLIWWQIGLGTKEWPPIARLNGRNLLWHALVFSFTVFLSGTKLFIDPPEIPSLEGRSESLLKVVFIIERVFGAFFSILFFIAIGATIVRQ